MGPLQATRVEAEGGGVSYSDYKADHTLVFLLRTMLSVRLRDFYHS